MSGKTKVRAAVTALPATVGSLLEAAVAVALAAALFCSCNLLAIPDVSGIVCFPDQENQVLAAGELPSIRFDRCPDRSSVEAIFSIADCAGAVAGAYRWEGSTVWFVPEPPLVCGRRYVLRFSGTFKDERDIPYEVDRAVHFFYISDSETGFYVTATVPAPGETACMNQEIRIEFSRAVDPLTVPDGLTLSPDTEHVLRWEDEGRTLLLRPADTWRNLTVYTLRIDGELRDTAGVSLAREEELVFLVQEDSEAPVVEQVVPAFNDPLAGFPETGLTLEQGPGYRDAIRLVFSEAMDGEATGEGFSIVPSLSGQLHWLDGSTLVFAPQEGYLIGVEYTLFLSEGACDCSGNPLAGYVPKSFTATCSPILVTTTVLDDGTVLAPGDYSTAVPRTISLGLSGECNLLLELSGGVFDTPGEKQRALEAVSLACIFPPSGVPAAEIIGVSWEGDFRLSVTYADLVVSTAEQGVYYLLRIRGGPTGVATDQGDQLEGQLEQLLRFEEGTP